MTYNTSVQSSTGYTFLFDVQTRSKTATGPSVWYKASHPESVENYAAHLKDSLTAAYSDVRDHLQVSHQRQKEIYDRKVHGEPYKKDDLVWLYNPATPSGQSKKLHHPWTGPYKILNRISDADYRIQEVFGKRAPSVVHFDRLKKCPPNTRFAQELPHVGNDVQDEPSAMDDNQLQTCFELELVDDQEHLHAPIRRSTRQRQQPDWYLPVITH